MPGWKLRNAAIPHRKPGGGLVKSEPKKVSATPAPWASPNRSGPEVNENPEENHSTDLSNLMESPCGCPTTATARRVSLQDSQEETSHQHIEEELAVPSAEQVEIKEEVGKPKEELREKEEAVDSEPLSEQNEESCAQSRSDANMGPTTSQSEQADSKACEDFDAWLERREKDIEANFQDFILKGCRRVHLLLSLRSFVASKTLLSERWCKGKRADGLMYQFHMCFARFYIAVVNDHHSLRDSWEKFVDELGENGLILPEDEPISEVLISCGPEYGEPFRSVMALCDSLGVLRQIKKSFLGLETLGSLGSFGQKNMKEESKAESSAKIAPRGSPAGLNVRTCGSRVNFFYHCPPIFPESTGGEYRSILGCGPLTSDSRQWLQLSCSKDRFLLLKSKALKFIQKLCAAAEKERPAGSKKTFLEKMMESSNDSSNPKSKYLKSFGSLENAAEALVRLSALSYIPASSSQYWGLGPDAYRFLESYAGRGNVIECYSSPFNSSLSHTCSAFHMDIALGSFGSVHSGAPRRFVVDALKSREAQKGAGSIPTLAVLCPPYLESELKACADVCNDILLEAELASKEPKKEPKKLEISDEKPELTPSRFDSASAMNLDFLSSEDFIDFRPAAMVLVVVAAWDSSHGLRSLNRLPGCDVVNLLLSSKAHSYWDYQLDEYVKATFGSRLFVAWRRPSLENVPLEQHSDVPRSEAESKFFALQKEKWLKFADVFLNCQAPVSPTPSKAQEITPERKEGEGRAGRGMKYVPPHRREKEEWKSLVLREKKEEVEMHLKIEEEKDERSDEDGGWTSVGKKVSKEKEKPWLKSGVVPWRKR